MYKINLIVPVFNEQDTVSYFVECVVDFFQSIDLKKYSYIITFINDGSSDNTLNILKEIFRKYDNIVVINLSRNFGKESALFAGLSQLNGDLFIPIDVDLQDPLNVIYEMLQMYEKGYDVVLAKRIDRSSDTLFKRLMSNVFYKVYNQLVDIKIESNVGDFRLMTRQVVEEIISLKENQLFMKGLFNWVGFNTAVVEYVRNERVAGKTKFNFFKLLKLAFDGITSFSTFPLKAFFYLGLLIAGLSFLFGIKIIVEKIFFGISELGYASIITAITFIGGIQIIGIGILGEYIGRIFLEAKQRPKYIIKDIYLK